MKSYFYFLVFLCFSAQSACSQIVYELNIKREGYPTCVFNTWRDETIVGLYFPDTPPACKLIKIDHKGVVVDSLLLDMEHYTGIC